MNGVNLCIALFVHGVKTRVKTPGFITPSLRDKEVFTQTSKIILGENFEEGGMEEGGMGPDLFYRPIPSEPAAALQKPHNGPASAKGEGNGFRRAPAAQVQEPSA